MKKVKYTVTLDLHRTGTQATVNAKAGDADSREIRFLLTERGRPFPVRDAEAVLWARKPDGTTLYNACTFSDDRDGVICYTVTSQTVAAEGIVEAELQIIKNGIVLGAPRFRIVVEHNLRDENAVESANEYTELDKLINNAALMNKHICFAETIDEIKQLCVNDKTAYFFCWFGEDGAVFDDLALEYGVIYWIYKDGTNYNTVFVGYLKGEDGRDGEDGYSPTVVVTRADDTTTIKITDKNGEHIGKIKDGKDGYTPQKGVDYFDGAPGEDGRDGYTPQKGVDYFDGAPGEDGITPHIGENGNWWIGEKDTGAAASAEITQEEIAAALDPYFAANPIDVPERLSELADDAGHRTVTDSEKAKWNAKVGLSDIVDDLTTDVSDKPLSAAQGVALKSLFDTLEAYVGKLPENTDTTSVAEYAYCVMADCLSYDEVRSEQIKELQEGKLDRSDLSAAVEDALTQAKASGEFDGADGEDGVGVAGVMQTVTSTQDSGTNVITVGLTDGSSSTFTVKNGSRGSTGPQGEKGETGAQGEKGDKGDPGTTQAIPLFANSIDECTDTASLYVLPDGYIYAYMYQKADYTNLLPLSTDTDGSIYNGVGYKTGYRINSSGAEVVNEYGMCATGILPVVFTGGETVRIKNMTDTNSSAMYIIRYDLDKNFKNTFQFDSYFTEENGIWVGTMPGVSEGYYARFSIGVIDETSIITVNEEIGGSGESGYQWTNTGHAFVPADYENRIIELENECADLKAELEDLGNPEGVPGYVLTEAGRVADNILSVRNADTFVMACVSDLHTSGSDTSAAGVLHAGQAMNEIRALTELDLIAILGDIQVGDFEESTTGSFKYVKKCFADAAKGVPYIHLQGNHDELSSDTTEKARQRYYAFIGANNVGTVTDYDNKFRNYGYRDFENCKVRVIYLNTADVSEYEMTYDNNLTFAQMTWLVNTALDLSVKDDADEWGVIVCGHHPLNWVASGNGSITKVLDVLDAYKGRTGGSVTVDGQSVAFDFSGERAEFICHIHGHLHNFREEVLGTNKVLSITVPNACFGRNNHYGTDYPDTPEVAQRYGDDGADNDGTGTQRIYTKTSGTAQDTAFSVFCIDRAGKTVNIFNYGAGIDRKWDYANGVKGEGGGDSGEATPAPTYTNLIPLSVNADGGEYIGTNGEDGYKTGYRINSSGAEVAADGMCCTGFIPYTTGQTVRLKNITVTGTATPYVAEYYADKTYKQVEALSTRFPDDGSGVYTGSVTTDCAYIRITCGVIDAASILTLDEPIE